MMVHEMSTAILYRPQTPSDRCQSSIEPPTPPDHRISIDEVATDLRGAEAVLHRVEDMARGEVMLDQGVHLHQALYHADTLVTDVEAIMTEVEVAIRWGQWTQEQWWD